MHGGAGILDAELLRLHDTAHLSCGVDPREAALTGQAAVPQQRAHELSTALRGANDGFDVLLTFLSKLAREVGLQEMSVVRDRTKRFLDIVRRRVSELLHLISCCPELAHDLLDAIFRFEKCRNVAGTEENGLRGEAELEAPFYVGDAPATAFRT